MNITFKEPLIFLGGAAVGFLAARIFLKKKYEKITDREIENAKSFYSQVVISEYTSDEPKEKEVESVPDRKENLYSSSGEKYVDYTKFYNRKTVDPAEEESPREDDPEEEEEFRAGERLTERANSEFGIRYISPDAYENDSMFPKETLFYYVGDETLVDEDENLIDNPEKVIGDAIEVYGLDYSDSQHAIWIRNFDLGCDYEVQKVNGSFRNSSGG